MSRAISITIPDLTRVREEQWQTTGDGSGHNRRAVEAKKLRKQLFASMTELVDNVQAEGRDLLASEQRDYDEAEKVLDELDDIYDHSFVDYAAQIPGYGSSRSAEYREGKPLTDDQTVAGYVQARQLVRDRSASSTSESI